MRWIRASRRRRLSAVAIVALTTVGLTGIVGPSASASVPLIPSSGGGHAAKPVSAPKGGGGTTSKTSTATSLYPNKVLAKATPDECFNGVGNPYPAGPPCSTGQAKVNQGYVWGEAMSGSKVFFGTGANVQCLTSGNQLGTNKPELNADYVCEYGSSQIVAEYGIPGYLGDFRSPDLYYYDTKTKTTVDETATVQNASTDDFNRLQQTVGIRAGGAYGGVVLMAGPCLGTCINLFAFDGDTGAYLGSSTMTQYGNIRHFAVAGDALYAGVGVGHNGDNGGYVLRWTGSKANPFSFEVVGNLGAQGADLTSLNGRLFVATWAHANPNGASQQAGIWMSPPLDGNSTPYLDDADATNWTEVWNVTEYEPDPLIAATYGMGGLAAYDGKLYFGTLHVPMKSSDVIDLKYPPASQAQAKEDIIESQRTMAIFRGSNFGTSSQKIEVLYGETQLPKYDPTLNSGGGGWEMVPTGYTPVFGHSGFGNTYNNYDWIMTVTDGKLFVGTMDWSYLAKDILPAGSNPIDPSLFGGELWEFDSPNKPAKAVSTNGIDNYLNYGVRNMVGDGKTLYLGMANPMNLRTDPNDGVPLGGWELVQMTIQ
jgi:hypothetical protein